MHFQRTLIFVLLITSLCLAQRPRPSRQPRPSPHIPSPVIPSPQLPSPIITIPSTLPSGLIPSGIIASLMASPPAVPSGLAPSGLVPSGLVPSGLVPSGLVPSGLVPSGLVPSGLVPSGLIPSVIPSPNLFSPSPAIPSGLIASPSPAIPSVSASPVAPEASSSPVSVPSTEASAQPSSSSLPQASPSPASELPSPSPAGSLITITTTEMTSYTDDTCRSAIASYFQAQIAYFGILLESNPSDGISNKTLQTVCIQKGSQSCVPVNVDTLASANGRDPVFSLDLADISVEIGASYTVKASVLAVMSDQTSQNVTVSSNFTTESSDRGSVVSGSAVVAPEWSFTALMVLAVGLAQFW